MIKEPKMLPQPLFEYHTIAQRERASQSETNTARTGVTCDAKSLFMTSIPYLTDEYKSWLDRGFKCSELDKNGLI